MSRDALCSQVDAEFLHEATRMPVCLRRSMDALERIWETRKVPVCLGKDLYQALCSLLCQAWRTSVSMKRSKRLPGRFITPLLTFVLPEVGGGGCTYKDTGKGKVVFAVSAVVRARIDLEEHGGSMRVGKGETCDGGKQIEGFKLDGDSRTMGVTSLT
ncbi:hypothetical protein Naga_100126g15 [Nannochloropsis gaditana]|uniref:Uncharacterized protein n=1 Tax=Nannochloropsis gaditana TaxID=72520 RepID=W7TGF8_9STRA|nr:hypothetical protein Naga_100126g15 [Nannochloropsis gaditana]